MAAQAEEEERGLLQEEEFLPALVWRLGPWQAEALAGWGAGIWGAGGWGRGHQHCFVSVCADSRVLWKVVLAFVQVRTHNLRLNRLCWQF